MTMSEAGWPLSLSLSAKNWAENKEQNDFRSAQSSASCQRSGRSPALPYPLHEYSKSTIPAYLSLLQGTSLLCTIGDISTLH
jgi:hypothetical protein